MIYVVESKPNKLPGKTSLFITFDFNKAIVEAIKSTQNSHYDAKTKAWEVPCTNLANLIDVLVCLDNISIHLLQDEFKQPDKLYEIGPFKTKPFKYQEEGIQFALNHDKFLLLDAPGLGKSLQAIYAAQERKKLNGIEHCLIVCGINTLKNNWKNEIKIHSDLTCRILGERITKKGLTRIGSVKERIEDLSNPIDEYFVITNIETLRNDDIIKLINNGPNKFEMIIFDECHKAKSVSSEQGKNFLKLTKAQYKIGMTGTLLLNSPMDSYVPLKWIGADNSTHTNFKYYYCTFTGPFNNILLGYKNLNVLKDMIESNSLRRTKDLLDLPPKNVIHEFVEMSDEQADFYSNIVNGIKDQVDKVEINTSTILSMVVRLRQATSCPSVLTSEPIKSSKIERAAELAREIVDNGDKVVIFSCFKETLNSLNNSLAEYNPLLCTGDVGDSIINDNIQKFQTNNTDKIMLATIQKMGTGITLTKASYAIFVDADWTSAGNLQAEDRIYRIGSKDPVFIYYLWNSGTIDEHVKELVEDKESISQYVVDNKITDKSINSLKKYILDL